MELNMFVTYFAAIIPLCYSDTTVESKNELRIYCILHNITYLNFFNDVKMEWHFQRDKRVAIINRQLYFNITGTSKYDIHISDIQSCNEEQCCREMDLDMEKGTVITLIIRNADKSDNGLYSCLLMYNNTVDKSIAEIGNTETTEYQQHRTENWFFNTEIPAEKVNEKCLSYEYEMTVIPGDSNDDIKKILQEKEAVWIGSIPWLYMLGCYDHSVVNDSMTTMDCSMVDIKADQKDTLKVLALGIQNRTCYLFERLPLQYKTSESHCNLKCTDIVEGNCGGAKAVSLFQIAHVLSTTVSEFDEKKCMALYKDTSESILRRQSCSSRCEEWCFNNNSTEFLSLSNGKFKRWQNAVENCLERNALLPGINLEGYTNLTHTNNSLPCLGVFRNPFISNSTQIIKVQKINGELVELKWNDSVNLPFICRTKLGPNIRTMKWTYVHDSKNATCLEESTSIRNGATETSLDYPTTSSILIPKRKSEPSAKMTLILVIVITSSVAGLAALILIVVCLKTRVFTKKIDAKHDISQNSEEMKNILSKKENVNSDVGAEVNYDYTEVPKPLNRKLSSENKNCYDYSVVEKKESESEYAETEAGEYDLLRTKRQKKEDCNEPMYDQTVHKTEGLYDVTNENADNDKYKNDDYYSSVVNQSTAINLDHRTDRDKHGVDNYYSSVIDKSQEAKSEKGVDIDKHDTNNYYSSVSDQ